ncbi:hypothetical protein [Streptosporangium sp. NPDC051022]|uniref:hypothetical protein n=1 Tax=Streptosporangium sp. NPDC051022 TaxID=3155752 RepID=UPI003421FE27
MIRRVLLTALLAVTGLAVVPGAPAQASVCPMNRYCVTTYYSDGTYTTAVGGKVEDCGADPYSWGTWGPYEKYYEGDC